MDSKTHHIIEITYFGDRGYYECSCGHAGSAAPDRVEILAERHVQNDEPISYRYKG